MSPLGGMMVLAAPFVLLFTIVSIQTKSACAIELTTERIAIATLRDGKKLSGAFDCAGELPSFHSADETAPMAWKQIDTIEFPAERTSASVNGGANAPHDIAAPNDVRQAASLPARIGFTNHQVVPGQLITSSADQAQVLLTGDSSPRTTPLAAIRFVENRSQGDQGLVDSKRDLAGLIDGAELWGKFLLLDDRNAEFEVAGAKRVTPSQHLAKFAFGRRAIEPVGMQGVIVRVSWQVSGRAAKESDLFVVEGVLSRDEQQTKQQSVLVVDAPWIGKVRISLANLRQIEVLSVGRRWMIDPHEYHLGNEVRSDFTAAQPDGAEIAIPFAIPNDVRDDIKLTLWASDVESSGRLGKYADEIAEGFLRTEVYLGDRRLDYLNRSIRGPSNQPQRVEIPIPRELLAVGPLLLKLRQTPQRNHPHEFDDCAVFGIAIEWTSPP